MKLSMKIFSICLIIVYYFCLGAYPGYCRGGGRGSGKVIGHGGHVSRRWQGGTGHKIRHRDYYYGGGYYDRGFGYYPYFPYYYGTFYPYPQGYYITPPRNGETFTYHPNGKIESVTSWKDGTQNGTAKWYYESGALKSETNWKNDRLDGICRWYFENGTLMAKGNWQEGRQHGRYTWYYESGMLKAEEQWDNGVRLSGSCYNENGDKILCRQE